LTAEPVARRTSITTNRASKGRLGSMRVSAGFCDFVLDPLGGMSDVRPDW
jgi:hypothetical protein